MNEPSPSVIGIVQSLATIGLRVRPEHVPAILSWSAVIGSALIAGWFMLAKARSDRRTLSVAQLLERVDKLTAEVGVMKEQMDEMHQENRRLRDRTLDQAELIEDMTVYIIRTDRHAEIGWAPPPPVKSWRIQDHLAEYKATKPGTEG